METTLSRRSTLKLMLGAGGAVLLYPGDALSTEKAGSNFYTDDGMDTPLVKILDDNSAIIYSPNPDMGQGTSTVIPMMIAEEMDLDWSRVRVETLKLRRRLDEKGQMQYVYARQHSGGSGSVRRAWGVLPQYGAQGRDMFLRAAADHWGVSVHKLIARDSHVFDTSSDKKLSYAELLEAVAKLSPRENVQLKKQNEYRLIGYPQRSKAAHSIVTGKPIFGLDQQIADMSHVVIARCPHFCGSLKSLDESAARQVQGVQDIVQIEQSDKDGPMAWLLVASVAVVADSLWAAKKARDLLEIEWNSGPYEGFSSSEVETESLAALDSDEGFALLNHEGRIREEGDFDAALRDAVLTHDAKYVVRRIAHALMEPHSCIADVRDSEVYLNCPAQTPSRIQDLAHLMTGIDHENIHVSVARSGGAFGRRWELDYPAEAILLSQKLKRPMKVTWTREDELTQCRYRAANNFRMTGGLNSEGKMIALRQRQASDYPTLDKDKEPAIQWPYEDLMGWHFEAGIVPNHRMEVRFTAGPVPRGPWRAPGSVNSAFAQASFLDEMAHKAGIDALEFQLSVLGKPRFLPDGDEGPMAMHTGRMANCLKLAADKAGWGEALPDGWGRGIAGYFSHVSFVAHVVEVSVIDGKLVVERVVTAADCGLVINPLGVKAQIEGSIHDGLSVAIGQEITIENATVVENNFDTYEMARIDAAPRKIEIHLVQSNEHPTGMGEPAIPPFAPALMNAIFNATGKRIRRLPIADQI
ncbi:xanthine dehydrogenase family protein molybdopterin-binding subunit [Kordiimonas aquimaris]|uniref:xanthine dehydrogenase family protein molybdopterin-binding subunit n=1 Tax=Kordiimonas aquimaris TaxID=707591 RepID=UPI0021D0867A|nr:molybdopterin cofactor-binding domain-containing protein [Kordiimonas aquimaris]